jgi:hypothetical protein
MRQRWTSEEDGRKSDDYQPDMPPLDGGDYLIGDLWEAGPTLAGAMGAGPLTFCEIHHWQESVGIKLNPWEARALRRLSIVYLNESHRAGKLGCEPPWKSPGFKREPTALQVSLRALADQ